jgi:hypothetical protein
MRPDVAERKGRAASVFDPLDCSTVALEQP